MTTLSQRELDGVCSRIHALPESEMKAKLVAHMMRYGTEQSGWAVAFPTSNNPAWVREAWWTVISGPAPASPAFHKTNPKRSGEWNV